VLARRQAAALSWGRRRHLLRLASKLGMSPESTSPCFVSPSRCHPYPLLGWAPRVEHSEAKADPG
jgi:hypothetical protein